jgi:hypothetical protein
MTTTLEELKSHETPSTTNVPSGHSSTPAVQAIIVNGVPIVEPQLASIIRNELEVVTAAPEDSQPTSPTHCKVVSTSESGPSATCVAVVHHVLPASMRGSAPIEVLAATSLTKVERILPEKTSTISGFRATTPAASYSTSATRTHNSPTVSSIGALVPEKHPGMTSTLKHLKSQSVCPSAKMLGGFAIAPAMQTVVVDCIPIVDPQLASIIGDNAEAVVASPSDSQGS